MKIAVLKEVRPKEGRVAATPETVKKITALGAEVTVESGAGHESYFDDSDYEKAGAMLASYQELKTDKFDVYLKVQRPLAGDAGRGDEYQMLAEGSLLICLQSPFEDRNNITRLAESGVNAVALELIPRISRAQGMDVLSSQSNLAGYKAVLDAASESPKCFPLMMTAAGTVPPAKVCVLGAGVAGLQAIATAKRLGAVVSAFDVRAAAKEQVQSLGATFVEVDYNESGAAEGGYAKEMSEGYKKRQAEVLHQHLIKQDIVITTALIPGRPAPMLIPAGIVHGMKPGAVIVDLAAPMGGNCEYTEADKVIVKNGVRIIGHTNYPSRMAAESSHLYARNIYNFLAVFFDKQNKTLVLNLEDEIVKGSLLTYNGAVVHPGFSQDQNLLQARLEEKA